MRYHLARFTPISSGQMTWPPSPAPMPIFTWVSAKVAERPATTTSQSSATVAPRPMA